MQLYIMKCYTSISIYVHDTARFVSVYVFIGCRNFFLALKMKPDYLKALLRRAQSYEATEKLEEALEGACQP